MRKEISIKSREKQQLARQLQFLLAEKEVATVAEIKEKGRTAEGAFKPEGMEGRETAGPALLQWERREAASQDAGADLSEPLGRAIRLFALIICLVITGGAFVALSHPLLPSLALHTKAQFGAVLMAIITSPLLFMMVRLVGLHISRTKDLHEELNDLSLTDNLTGLCTRREFTFFFEQTLKRAHRLNRSPFMLYAAVDGLKGINETWGHPEGNAALVEAARMLNETYRQSDIIARVGGNKFAILVLVTEPTEENLQAMAARLQRRIRHFNDSAARPYRLSMNVSVVPIEAASPPAVDELLARGGTSVRLQERCMTENPGAACLAAAQ